MPYTIEYAKSSRSHCRNPNCQDPLIRLGELRLGTKWPIKGVERIATSWYHWKCVSTTTLSNIGSPKKLQGFELLTKLDQELVKNEFKVLRERIIQEQCESNEYQSSKLLLA